MLTSQAASNPQFYGTGSISIPVVDDVTSLVRQRAEEHARILASIDLRERVRKGLSDRLSPERSGINVAALEGGKTETRHRVEQIAHEIVAELQRQGWAGRGPIIPDELVAELVRYAMDWQFGAGPLEPLFRENDVEDIVINTHADSEGVPGVQVWTYRQSGKRREQIAISVDEVREIINRNAGYQGRALNPTTPILNAQMRNGARMNAVIDPVCDPGLSATIRIHRLVARSFDDLVRLGTLSQAAAAWLWLCVQGGLATVVAGGTSSGKTNFLNAVARVMPEHLRVVVIEDTRELDLNVSDKVYLVTVQHPDASRLVSQRQLVANALRMRPDRIVLGEVRDGAAWDAVKACNTGHDGTLLSLHAEDAEGVLVRLAQLCNEAPETSNLSERTLREIIASAFQCVVFLERRRQLDGSYRRFVTQINEVNGFVSDGITNQKPLFKQASTNGELIWTGQWPHERIKKRLAYAGFSEQDLSDALQGRSRPWVLPQVQS